MCEGKIAITSKKIIKNHLENRSFCGIILIVSTRARLDFVWLAFAGGIVYNTWMLLFRHMFPTHISERIPNTRIVAPGLIVGICNVIVSRKT